MSKRTFIGKIVSDKMQSTVTVLVDVPKKHKVYGKKLKSTNKFLSKNTVAAKLGDIVLIEESRPFSKNCSWTIIKKFEESLK